jgi:nitroreductase
MILTAWSEGVGSNWVGFIGMSGIKPLLSIPEELDILAILCFGYANQVTGKGKKRRKPLSEVAWRERFGQPY